MIHRAITLDQETAEPPYGPSPVMTVATHKLQNVRDPKLHGLTIYELNRWTTIPVPSSKAWKDEVAKDVDLNHLKKAVIDKTPLCKENLIEKGYYLPFQEERLAYEDGEWYHYEEPKKARV